jgi:hypothetical protein
MVYTSELFFSFYSPALAQAWGCRIIYHRNSRPLMRHYLVFWWSFWMYIYLGVILGVYEGGKKDMLCARGYSELLQNSNCSSLHRPHMISRWLSGIEYVTWTPAVGGEGQKGILRGQTPVRHVSAAGHLFCFVWNLVC